MSETGAWPGSVGDTNRFVSGAISSIGASRRLLRAWNDRRFRLRRSDQQYAELTEVFRRPKLVARFRLTPAERAGLFATLAIADRVEPSPTVPVPVRDAKDVMILAAALGGHADYLVTGDDDLLAHRGDALLGTLRIVTASAFLARLDEVAAEQWEPV